MCQREAGPDTHGRNVQSHSTARGSTGGKHFVLFLSKQPSTLTTLSSSWSFPFVCLSADNGRLSVTQCLTQIHSGRRKTGSGMMRISLPFTHKTHPPQSELLTSQMWLSKRKHCSLGSVFSYCRRGG